MTAVPGDIRGRSRGILALVGALCCLLPGLAGQAAAQIAAHPVILEVRTTDSTATSSFMVRNEGPAPIQLRIYAGDFDQPEDGGHVFMASGEHPSSCAGRLRFYPDNILLQGGATERVRVLMAPRNSTCWSMLFVQTVSRSESGFQVAHRIGVKVYGVNARPHLEGEIRRVAVESNPGSGERIARIDFENRGGGPVRPAGRIEIRSIEGVVVGTVRIEPFSVLPGRVRQTVVPIPLDLAPGGYLAIPILDFGASYLAGGQALFEVGRP